MKKFKTSDFDITNLIENQIEKYSPEPKNINCEGMKVKDVHEFIVNTIKELAANKKITLSFLIKNQDGVELTLEVDSLELDNKNNTLYINQEIIRDGDIKSCDNVISVCKKVLNIQLWIDKKIERESYEVLESDETIEDMTSQLNRVNSHNKLLRILLKSSSLKYFRSLGYTGVEEDFISSLLYALEATSAYTVYSDLTEGEYFAKIIEQMNLVSRHT